MDYGKAAYLKVSDLARRFNAMLVEKADKAEKTLRLIKNAHSLRSHTELRFEFSSLEASDVEVDLSLTFYTAGASDQTTFNIYVNRMFYGAYPVNVSQGLNSSIGVKFVLPAFEGDCLVCVNPIGTNSSTVYEIVSGYMNVTGKRIVKWRKKPVLVGINGYNGAAYIGCNELYGYISNANSLTFCNKPPEENIVQADIQGRPIGNYFMIYLANGTLKDVQMKQTFPPTEQMGSVYSYYRTLAKDVRCYVRYGDSFFYVGGDNCVYSAKYTINDGLTSVKKLAITPKDRVKKLAVESPVTLLLNFVLEYEGRSEQYTLANTDATAATFVRELPDTGIKPLIFSLNDVPYLFSADDTMAYCRAIGTGTLGEKKAYGICDDILVTSMNFSLWRDYTYYTVGIDSAK